MSDQMVVDYLSRRNAERARHKAAWEALRMEYHAMTPQQRLEADLAEVRQSIAQRGEP